MSEPIETVFAIGVLMLVVIGPIVVFAILEKTVPDQVEIFYAMVRTIWRTLLIFVFVYVIFGIVSLPFCLEGAEKIFPVFIAMFVAPFTLMVLWRYIDGISDGDATEIFFTVLIFSISILLLSIQVLSLVKWFVTDHYTFWSGFKELIWALVPFVNITYVWDWLLNILIHVITFFYSGLNHACAA